MRLYFIRWCDGPFLFVRFFVCLSVYLSVPLSVYVRTVVCASLLYLIPLNWPICHLDIGHRNRSPILPFFLFIFSIFLFFLFHDRNQSPENVWKKLWKNSEGKKIKNEMIFRRMLLFCGIFWEQYASCAYHEHHIFLITHSFTRMILIINSQTFLLNIMES